MTTKINVNIRIIKLIDFLFLQLIKFDEKIIDFYSDTKF